MPDDDIKHDWNPQQHAMPWAAESGPSLSDRFLIPPFSVLNARDGRWQERKAKWLALGIQSEIGRAGGLLNFSDSANDAITNSGRYANKGKLSAEKKAAKLAAGETATLAGGLTFKVAPVGREGGLIGGSAWDGSWVKRTLGEDYTGLSAASSGTSIFDPVLCELAYRWFCPPAGRTLDPFAGGSVRGVVAVKLGRSYVGIDLRPEQVAANREQAHVILNQRPDAGPPVDSDAVVGLFKAHDKGLTAARFTPGTPVSVGEWIEAGQLRVALAEGKPIAAIAIRTVTKSKVIQDFSGAMRAQAPAGSTEVMRIAGDGGAIMALLEREALGACYFRLWQEHPVDRAIGARLNLQWLGTKISAAAEMFGLWGRGIESVPTPPAEMATLARLKLPPLNTEPLAAALGRLPAWTEHYSTYNKRHSWHALALRGYGGDPAFIIKPSEMSRDWRNENPDKLNLELQDTPLRALLPEAEALIDAVPGKKHRIRLMRLTGNDGELSRHADITDPDAGVGQGQTLRIHIPILSNPSVIVEQWNLTGAHLSAHMAAGEAWYLDTRKPHRVTNKGAVDRVHLVMDVESNPALLDMLISAPDSLTVEAVAPAQLPEGLPSIEIARPMPPSTDSASVARAEWVEGDAVDAPTLAAGEYDFILTCPPYGDLERYSDDARDLSTMEYDAMLEKYREIIRHACSMLKPDRFAFVVVANFRTPDGSIRDFVSETRAAFEAAGLRFYNDAILVTAVGSLPIRVRRQFEVARKFGKTHQNILVFIKGDDRAATAAVGAIALAEAIEEAAAPDAALEPAAPDFDLGLVPDFPDEVMPDAPPPRPAPEPLKKGEKPQLRLF